MIPECMQMRTWITQFEEFMERQREDCQREAQRNEEVHFSDLTKLAMETDKLKAANKEIERLSKENTELKNKIKEMEDTSQHNDNKQEKADPV